MKKYIFLVAFILVVGLAGCGTGGNKNQEGNSIDQSNKTAKSTENTNDQKTATNKGVTAPDFTLSDRDGNQVTLSDLQGKKVYLKFWASWCGVCNAGMPDLTELVQDEDKDFEVYTIIAPGFSGEKSKEDFITWYDEQGYSKDIKVLFDEDGEVMKTYGIRAFPTNAFIGSDGILVRQLAAGTGKEQIKQMMETVQ